MDDRLPNHPSIGGPVRLGALIASGKLLWCYCRQCCRERDLEPATLPLPADTPVPDVGRHMKCSACGSRKITTAPELYPGGVVEMRRRYQPKPPTDPSHM